MKRILKKELIESFEFYLKSEEKSDITVKKYVSDVRKFYEFVKNIPIEKSAVLEYKAMLTKKYAARSVNSKLAALGSLFKFLGWRDLKVKSLKLQHRTYSVEDKELSKAEYLRLCNAASSNKRLSMIIKTICATGIRVSELKFFTIEAVKRGEVTVRCKSKTRTILIPSKLTSLLISYAKRNGISSGIIFRTRSGKAVDRSNIWSDMKKLCAIADVNPSKVFPHNLRKLFARTFYGLEKDIAKLADILGHSSIETTRIYIMSTGTEHRQKIDRLKLVT